MFRVGLGTIRHWERGVMVLARNAGMPRAFSAQRVPTIMVINGWRFHFFSNEGPRPHVHVVKGGASARVWLDDGRVVSARYEQFARLSRATPEQRERWELVGAGVGIHWPELDEDLSTEGLLRDAVRVEPASVLFA